MIENSLLEKHRVPFLEATVAGFREEVYGNLQQFVLQAKCFSKNSQLASAQPLARHHPHHREAHFIWGFVP